jgi:alkaline phosphatase D
VISRRRFLESTVFGLAPAIVRRQTSRPALPQGVAAGDVGNGRAVIWSRCDRQARMAVEYSTTESFHDVRRVAGVPALASSDGTARTVLTGLPRGQRIFYRVTFHDPADVRARSEPVLGSFNTPPSPDAPRDVTLAWSADTCGQGWGINQEWGGLRLYETMRKVQPDLFIHVGDTIYADAPIPPEITLEDGSIWRNVVTPAKSKVAETLDEFRGNYQYNLMDEHMRRFNAEVPQFVIWDDHEVMNNWYPTRSLADDRRYKVKDIAVLSSRARQAFLEYTPLPIDPRAPRKIHRVLAYGPEVEIFGLDLRSYRGVNSANRQAARGRQTAILGAGQLSWLKTRLAASRATWKVIACDMPIGLIVGDGPRFEAIANGDHHAPLGRELEIADLLRFIRDRDVRNLVWITGDVHYCAAHHYDPSRARFGEFNPFWEFVAGPLNAGTFGPGQLDRTFGPEVKFVGIPPGMKPNRPPSDGYQFFGTLRIAGRSRVLTAGLHDLAGRDLFKIELMPT